MSKRPKVNNLYEFIVESFVNTTSHNYINIINKEYHDNNIDIIFSNTSADSIDVSCVTNDTIVLNDNVLNDLEIFVDNSGYVNNSIYSKINYTTTLFGNHILKNMLMHPTTNVSYLIDRQQIINTLITNNELYTTISFNLEQLKDCESTLMWFWKEKDESINYIYDMLYFTNRLLKPINTNKTILQLLNMYHIVISPSMSLVSPLIYIIVPMILFKLYKTPIKLGQLLKIIKVIVMQRLKINWNNIKNVMSVFLTVFSWVFVYFQGIYYTIIHAISINNSVNFLHRKIQKVANIIIIIDKIINDIDGKLLIFGNPDVYNYVKHKMYILMDILNNSNILSEPTVFENKGVILASYYKFIHSCNDLIPLLKTIGLIDAYLSISKLFIKNKYTFTEYIKHDKPIIRGTRLVHPYLNKSISNNIMIDKRQNMIITGPNAAGKSTFLKSLATNILLSQTFGIVSCKTFELTPFSHINTYLHIPDTKGYSSLFQAEMHRSKQHIDKIKSLCKTDFSFVIMDEIFSSTNYNEGFSAAYAISEKLGSFTNSVSIITTHYNKLSLLEKTTNTFNNYKFTIKRDIDNNIIFPYKLCKGVSNQYIALELLRNDGFDDDIIKTATRICNKLSDNCQENKKEHTLSN
jgi:DNA mismatch repair protein MutS